MPTPFRIVVRDEQGELKTITIEAETRQEAGETALLRGWEVVGLEGEVPDREGGQLPPQTGDAAAQRKRRRLVSRVALYTTLELEHPQYRVAEVLPVVTAERVYGTGVWSDIKIGLRDAFGGRSATGEKLIQQMIRELRADLQEAAADAGGNIVLGFQLRIDAVGEGAQRMFYGTAYGSPAKLTPRHPEGTSASE